jgi:hypothetical protein
VFQKSALYQGTTSQLAEKSTVGLRFVSGHDFSRAASTAK